MNRPQLFNGFRISTLWNRHLPVLLAVCAGVGFSVAVFFVVRGGNRATSTPPFSRPRPIEPLR